MTDITFSILLFRTKLLGQIHGQISHRPTLSGEICKHSFISTVIPCTVHMVNIYRVSVPSKSFIFKFLRCSVEGASWKTMGPFTIVLLSSLSRTQDFIVREIEKTCKEIQNLLSVLKFKMSGADRFAWQMWSGEGWREC